MIEVLMVLVVLGVGLGGVARLLNACLRGEGEARRRMEARVIALNALEVGGAAGATGPFTVDFLKAEDHSEVRVSWDEGGRIRDARFRRAHA